MSIEIKVITLKYFPLNITFWFSGGMSVKENSWDLIPNSPYVRSASKSYLDFCHLTSNLTFLGL